ncbi:MAG: tetratricopeptide repeat protein [SAR324 cluster bacterium]|nr:tetratricopeptide repeat protein [SAR324 cluster bacterium]
MNNQNAFRPLNFLCAAILLFLLSACSQPAYIQQNDRLVAEGQLDKAIENYRQLIAEDPHDSERYYQLAKVLFQKGANSKALKTIEQAITIDHLIGRYQLLAGKIKFVTHDYFQAINHLTNALVLNPQYLDAYYYLSLAHEQTGQAAKALELLQTAISIEPLYFDAHLAWAQIRFRQLTDTDLGGTFKTANISRSEASLKEFLILTDKLEDALKINPVSVPGNLLLSRIYFSLGAEYKARILLENWLNKFEPDDTILLALAQIEYRSGRFDQAIQKLSQQRQPGLESLVLGLKIEINTEPTPATAAKIDTLLKQYPDSEALFLLSGQWELMQGNIISAERLIQKSLELNPEFAEAYFSLSRIYEVQNDTAGSLFAMRKALQLAPNNLEIKLRYLNDLVEEGNWYEAEALLKNYALSSDHPEVIFLKGIIAKEKGDYNQATQFFLNAQQKQYSVRIETQLADIELRQGQYHSAETRLKRIGDMYPDNLEIALVRARLMVQTKRSEEIIPLLTPYLSSKLATGKIHLLLAEALIQQGKTEAALQTLATALKRWPRDPDLVQAYTLYLGLLNKQQEAIPLLEDMQTFAHPYNRLFYYRLRAYYFLSGDLYKFKNYIYHYQLEHNTVKRLTP